MNTKEYRINNKNNKIKMNAPIYDDNETISEYVARVDLYLHEFKKEKYEKILNFVNAWLEPLNKKITALTEFKNLSEKKLFKNTKHNRKVLKTNAENLKAQLFIKTSIDDETDSDEINDQHILRFTMKLLNTIDYSIISVKHDDEILYSIKNKKPIKL